MLVNFKDIPFYYLNFEGYTDRKVSMEKLLSSLNINNLRISNSYQSNLRQDRIAFGVTKLLNTAIEIGKYPFIMMDDDIQLIQDCMEHSTDSTPYCPTMKSMRIKDLLDAMILKYSNDQNIEVEIIGLQPGENMHEKVLEEGPYSNEVEHFTVEEILPLI